MFSSIGYFPNTIAGVPNLQAEDWYWSGPVRNWAIQLEVSLNIMLLNHPKTIPLTPVRGKIVFYETGPGAKKFGHGCFREPTRS